MQSKLRKFLKKRGKWSRNDLRNRESEVKKGKNSLGDGEEHSSIRSDENQLPKDEETRSSTEEVYESMNQKGDFKMSREALFCDGTSSYVIPPEPAKGQMIRLRFRTARSNVSTVLLVADSGIYPMERILSRGAFDYYQIAWKLGEEPFSYYFEIHCGDEVCYYNRTGVSDDIKPHYSFRIVPGFSKIGRAHV